MAVDLQDDFKSYQEKVAAALVNVTKSANVISTFDLGFHRSYSSDVSKALDSQNAHLLRLTNKLLKAAAKDTSLKVPALKEQEDVDDRWRSIVDIVDGQLEKADAALDEVNGLVKRQSPAQPSTPEPTSRPPKQNNYRNTFGMIKPQKFFDRPVDNFQTGRWRPLLTSKPNAMVALEESIGNEETGFKNPYQPEIEAYTFPTELYEQSQPIPFIPLEDSHPIWVDTEEGMYAMLQELKQAKEIAVDLEHNNNNSYVGMVSLMQISTRENDWVVDTLRPWRENLQCLNEVFTDPTIIKVFHGSSSDIIWLQRDHGLYVVGLFDTYYAAIALNYPGKGLAYLLKKHANFDANKAYQLADWRIRPLPQDYLDYARSDTHFLLYIYDCLRNDLVACSTPTTNLVDYVFEQSKKECLQTYERFVYDRENGLGVDGWLKILVSKNSRALDQKGFGIFKALHEWRDNKAREADEGPHAILSNNYLWACAEQKPRTKFDLFGRFLGVRCPEIVAGDPNLQDELMLVIRRGAEEGEKGPTLQEVIQRNADKLSTVRAFRHANAPIKPQQVNMSLGSTMQQLVKNGDMSSPVHDTSEPVAARAMASSLFGQLPPSHHVAVHDPAIAQIAANGLLPLHISRPIPVPTTVTETIMTDAPPVQPPQDTVPLDDGTGNDTFVLRKQKRRTVDDGIDDEEDQDESFSPTFHGLRAEKRAAKRARKAADKAARESEPTTIPFDYANAPSVLHAPSDKSQTTNPTVKPMNPFTKSLDTTTGAKRNKFGKELAGKSHTFSS